MTERARTYVEVPITASVEGLAEGDRAALPHLKAAVEIMDRIYLLQRRLPPDTPPGPIESSVPNNYYPGDLTREEFQQYVKDHPDRKADLESPVRVVRRIPAGNGPGSVLGSVPYDVLYDAELNAAAQSLHKAAYTVTDPAFRSFLLARAHAFWSNDYEPSDVAWINVTNSPVELTVGPYEEYDDKLLGLKRSFEGILGIVDVKETEVLRSHQKLASEFDAHLAKTMGYRRNAAQNPMIVVDEILAGGHSVRGFVPVAYNLPNDTSIRSTFGFKQVFLRNKMRAKFEHMTRKIANRVLVPSIARLPTAEIQFLKVVGHELAHGLGIYCKDGLQEIGPALEEAKADIFGLLFFYFLADNGYASEEKASAIAVTRIADAIRQIRFGQDEAHGFGSLIQLNWLREHGALRIEDGLIDLSLTSFRSAIEGLARAFAAFAVPGNYGLAKSFIGMWGKKIEALDPILAKLEDLAVDIRPVYEK